MEVVFLLYGAASILLGLFQPAFIVALSLHSYNYEEYFGGADWFGGVLIALTPAVALLHLAIKQRMRLHMLDILFAVFSLCFVVMVLRSPDPNAGSTDAFKFLLAIVGMYIAPRAFFTRTKAYRNFTIAFVISYALQALLFATVAEVDPNGLRTTIGEGNAVGFGLTLSAALCLVVFWMLAKRPWTSHPLLVTDWILASLALAGLAYAANLNGTRGIFVSVIGATILYGAVRLWWHLLHRSVALAFFGALAFVVSVAALLVLAGEAAAALDPETINERLRHLVMSIANDVWATDANRIVEGLSESREHLYAAVWDLVRNEPLLGVGLNGVRMTLAEKVHEETFAHNLLLELWAEGGIVMLLVFIAMTSAIIVFGLRQIGEERTAFASTIFVGMAMATLLHQQVSATLLFAKAAFLALGVLAAAEAVRAHRVSAQRRRVRKRRGKEGFGKSLRLAPQQGASSRSAPPLPKAEAPVGSTAPSG